MNLTNGVIMFLLSECEFDRVMMNDVGFCLACKEEATVYEPDARHYTCEECSKPQVFSAIELQIMGLVDIKADDNEPALDCALFHGAP